MTINNLSEIVMDNSQLIGKSNREILDYIKYDDENRVDRYKFWTYPFIALRMTKTCVDELVNSFVLNQEDYNLPSSWNDLFDNCFSALNLDSVHTRIIDVDIYSMQEKVPKKSDYYVRADGLGVGGWMPLWEEDFHPSLIKFLALQGGQKAADIKGGNKYYTVFAPTFIHSPSYLDSLEKIGSRSVFIWRPDDFEFLTSRARKL